MPHKELSVEVTMQLANRALAEHSPVSGECPDCSVPWPCAAAERIEETLNELSTYRQARL